jgi:hypothetical protein
MNFTKKQATIGSVIGTAFISFALSPVLGAIFAFCMFTLLTM